MPPKELPLQTGLVLIATCFSSIYNTKVMWKMMDEISVLQVETNQVKLKQDFDVSVMNKYLMAFHSMVTIAWYIQSVTGFHNFLFRLNANMVNEHKACASGRRWTCLQSFSIWYLILIYCTLSGAEHQQQWAKLHEAVGVQQLWCREHGLGVLPVQSWAGRMGTKCPPQGQHSELGA